MDDNSASELADQDTFTNSPENAMRDSSSLSPFLENNEANPEFLTSEIKEFEINFKLIIKVADGKCDAAKWKTIIANDFREFRNSLDRLIQEQFEDRVVFREEYNIAYKQEKEAGPGTQLMSKNDWERFLKENERIITNRKVLLILVKMKRSPKKASSR